ncbi:MAG: KilA-N domain-containing protein [Candidatus Saccharimonadales bacterium]
MSPVNNLSMVINESVVNVTKINGEDYICLTDMARSSGQDRALFSWIRTKNTVGFLGLWEQLHNPDFKVHEFVYFKNNAGENSFNPSITEWTSLTNAKGIVTKRGRYGGTYAHKDIAFEFGTWLSPEFKLLIITEFQRLKASEQKIIEWDSKRYLSRVNYRLHTDSIKNVLLPALNIIGDKQNYVYTDEADMLNAIVFGKSAAQWKLENTKLAVGGKNQRDYASLQQLVVLANLESLNSHLISQKKNQHARAGILVNEARRQYMAFVRENDEQKRLEG